MPGNPDERSIKVDSATLDLIKQVAKAEDRTIKAVVRRAVEAYMKQPAGQR